jgi:hypothetical protein
MPDEVIASVVLIYGLCPVVLAFLLLERSPLERWRRAIVALGIGYLAPPLVGALVYLAFGLTWTAVFAGLLAFGISTLVLLVATVCITVRLPRSTHD